MAATLYTPTGPRAPTPTASLPAWLPPPVPKGTQTTTDTVTLTGPVTATFTWQGSSPAPESAIVTETDQCHWDESVLGNGSITGMCDDGLGQVVSALLIGPGGGASTTLNGVRYEGKGGSSVAASWTPNLPFTIFSGTVSGANVSASLSCTATISPVTIALTGPIKDSSGNLHILVGQQCSTTLNGIGWQKLSPADRAKFGTAQQAKLALQKAIKTGSANVKAAATKALKNAG